MGEIAEMMLDGTMDPETGEFNFDGEDGPGWPMTGAEAEAYKRDMSGLMMAGPDTTEIVYLAARYSRHEEMQRVAYDLANIGIDVSARWIQGGHTLEKEGSTQADDEARTRFATEDMGDLLVSDTLIAFTEEPRATNTRGGRHVEFGMAVALGHRVLVVGPRENVFYHLDMVEHFETWPEALQHLIDNPIHPESEADMARLESHPVPGLPKPPGQGTSKSARKRRRKREEAQRMWGSEETGDQRE